MAYLVWFTLGVLAGLVMGVILRRSLGAPTIGGRIMAGGLGGLIGGVIGDGIPAALAGEILLPSLFAAVLGGLLMSWAVAGQRSDVGA